MEIISLISALGSSYSASFVFEQQKRLARRPTSTLCDQVSLDYSIISYFATKFACSS